jgi:hypothetical protein
VNPWIFAVLVASGLTLAGVVVVVLGSVSVVKDLGRSARRFSDEVGGLASDISRDAAQVSDRTAQLQAPGRSRSS